MTRPARRAVYLLVLALCLSTPGNRLLAQDVSGDSRITIVKPSFLEPAFGQVEVLVDDVVIGADGKADTLVFKSGDFFGLGGKRGALDYGSVDITVDAKAEPRVRVSMTKEAIQSVATYETTEMNDYNLASELISASADLMSSDDKATITDLILASDGSVNHVIVQNGVIGAIGGEPVAIGYDKVAIEQGDGGVVIGLTPEMLSAAQPFTYETVIETTVESADAPSQP